MIKASGAWLAGGTGCRRLSVARVVMFWCHNNLPGFGRHAALLPFDCSTVGAAHASTVFWDVWSSQRGRVVYAYTRVQCPSMIS
jgi:hypothetical protein